MCKVLRGRIVIFQSSGADGSVTVPIDVAVVRVAPILRCPATSQLRRMRELLSPIDVANTIVIGDFNTAAAKEGRLEDSDINLGANGDDDGDRHDDAPMAPTTPQARRWDSEQHPRERKTTPQARATCHCLTDGEQRRHSHLGMGQPQQKQHPATMTKTHTTHHGAPTMGQGEERPTGLAAPRGWPRPPHADAATPATPPAGPITQPTTCCNGMERGRRERRQRRVFVLLNQANQSDEKTSTATIIDAVLDRTQGHENATLDIITRLDHQGRRMITMETEQAAIQDNHEKRLAAINDWVMTMAHQMIQLEDRMAELPRHQQQRQDDTTMVSTVIERLRLLEEQNAASAAQKTAVAEAAARSAVQSQAPRALMPTMRHKSSPSSSRHSARAGQPR